MTQNVTLLCHTHGTLLCHTGITGLECTVLYFSISTP